MNDLIKLIQKYFKINQPNANMAEYQIQVKGNVIDCKLQIINGAFKNKNKCNNKRPNWVENPLKLY